MSANESVSLNHPIPIDLIKYDDRGLVPAIVQDYLDGTVLMMAWMNSESLARKPSSKYTVEFQTFEVCRPMHKCPHCSTPTISSFDKWRSEPLFPATCSKCGALSYIDNKSITAASLGAIAISIIGIWFAAQLMSFYPLAAAAPLAIGWFYSIWYPAPLVKTDINKVADLGIHTLAACGILILMATACLIFFSVI